MRAFLQALQKKLTDVMRRLRALALQFARRSQPAGGKRTQPGDRPSAPTTEVFPGEVVPEAQAAKTHVEPVEQPHVATLEPPPPTALEVAQTPAENAAPGHAGVSKGVSTLVAGPPAAAPDVESASSAASVPPTEPLVTLTPASAQVGQAAALQGQERAQEHPGAVDTSKRDGAKAEQHRAREGPRSLRSSPESYEQPFIDPGLRPPADKYAVWNMAVVQHCLLGDASEGQEVYLTITPRILAGALSEVVGANLAPEEAEVRFADAVSEMYRTRVLPHPGKLQVLRRCGSDGLPECVAFLALSVLAAYRMHTDEGAAANAYYKRLDELLLCGLSGGLPRGFDPAEFEGLWLFLRAWLVREHSQQMAMPGPHVGPRRYVALPLTHVPLRQVDIERLPDFFDWAEYEAGERVPIERIDTELSEWVRVRGTFTSAGMDALADERRAAVLAQIAHELECWDGSLTDMQGRRTAPVEVFLQWERRIPVLSYLPKRPAAFPAVFDDGQHVLDAGQEGWYEPLRIGVEDGPELESGFSWETSSNGMHIVLRRVGASAIAMAPSEFAGPVSHHGLLLGASGAALCQEALVVLAQKYLDSVTGKQCVAVQLSDVPRGWTLFVHINPVHLLPPPDGLEPLEVVTTPQIIPQGGLRLGRRWAWLAEAPPRLLVAGFDPSERVTVDGKPVEVDAEGVVRDEGRLSTPGVRVVEIGRVRRRFEIVDPEVLAASLADVAAVGVDRRRVTALPEGSWTVVGARPGETTYAASRRWGQGVLVCCPFDPVWAMSYGCGRGATVLCLVERPPLPGRLPAPPAARFLQSLWAWAEAIYNANMRRPVFSSPGGSMNIPQARAVWTEYARTAKEIKRWLRAERR